MCVRNANLIVLVVSLCLVTAAGADDLSDLDPNLVGWWRFEEGAGTESLDDSGNGFHGTLMGDPTWSPGYEGLALDLDGVDDYVETGRLPSELGVGGDASRTSGLWVYTRSFNGGGLYEMGGDAPGEGFWLATTTTNNVWHLQDWNEDITFQVDSLNEWTHLAHVYEDYESSIYANGRRVTHAWGILETTDERTFRIGCHAQACFDGLIDDVRLYNMAVPDEQIAQIMRANLAQAWGPQPGSGASATLDQAAVLHWSPGADAVAHDVYFGTDRTAAGEATIATPGVYQGRVSAEVTAFIVPEAVLQWNTTYYWRVDEVNASSTVTHGNVWSFTTLDYLVVDDFEQYSDNLEAGQVIWQTWLDGIEDANNGNSYVGYPVMDNFMLPVRSGVQSMPLFYFNGMMPWYSQATRIWGTAQDWTRHGVDGLTLWVFGAPPAFHERSDGTILMTGWRDQFGRTQDRLQFGSKRLTGDGAIIARIDSLVDTDPNTRAGVMIRSSAAEGAEYASVFVTAGNGVVFQSRAAVDGPTEDVILAGPQTPYWVKLTRQGHVFNAYCGADGLNWTEITDAAGDSNVQITMSGDVLVGVAVADAGADRAASAEFSNVSVSGNASTTWADTRIGHPYRYYWIGVNDPGRLYVEIADAAGNRTILEHPQGAEAAWIVDWEPWNIPLDRLFAAGVDPAHVTSLTIGLGDREDPTQGGEGNMHFDDIRLTVSDLDPDGQD